MRREREEADGRSRVDSAPWPFEEPWRFHDLRRTVATRLEDDLSTSKPLISAILNHAEGGATAIYTRGQLRDQKLAAMEGWGRFLAKLCEAPHAPDCDEQSVDDEEFETARSTAIGC